LSLDDLLDLYARHHSTAGVKLTTDDALAKFEQFVTEGGLDSVDEDTRPRIMLVAKSFQVEVTATVLWLRESWGMDISCIELVPYKLDDKLVLSSSVRIPLPEAAEYTIKRDQKRQKAQAGPKVNWEKAMEVMAAIPAGYWMSYADLAVAAGGSRAAALAVGNYLANTNDLPPNCVHRVLLGDGKVSDAWRGDLGGPEEAQALLESEGLVFTNGRADKNRRWKPSVDVGV
jgi:alkylated DNA nucleotide flippase Atl1